MTALFVFPVLKLGTQLSYHLWQMKGWKYNYLRPSAAETNFKKDADTRKLIKSNVSALFVSVLLKMKNIFSENVLPTET